MTLITSLPLKESLVGTEEFVINYDGVDYKTTSQIINAVLQDALNAYIETNDAAIEDLQTLKLDLSGGTMTGSLVLSGDPTADLHAVTKQWVVSQLGNKLNATGATLDSTATAVTAANTSESTAIATTEFVSNKIEYELLKKTTINNPTVTLTEEDKGTILIKRTTISSVVVTLPEIAALDSTDRTEYWIVDSGLNAETNNITITANASDTINGASTYTISTNGGGILVAVSESTKWIVKNLPPTASTTSAGLIELATDAETTALTVTDKSTTPSNLGALLDATLYNRTEVGAATKTLAEDESGIIAVTYSSTGTCTITLPVISTLTSPNRVIYYIVDEGLSATTNPITINPGTGNTINGLSTFKLVSSGESIILENNGGTKWFIVSNFDLARINGSHGYLAGNQSLSNATWETVAFDTIASLNTLTQLDTGTGIFTPARTAYYLAEAVVYFSANATGVRGVRIVENDGGDKVRACTIISSYATYDAAVSVNAMFASSSSSTIRVEAFQSSTGALDAIGGTLQDSHFRVIEK